MDRLTVYMSFALIALTLLCVTVLAGLKVVDGAVVADLSKVLAGGLLGFLAVPGPKPIAPLAAKLGATATMLVGMTLFAILTCLAACKLTGAQTTAVEGGGAAIVQCITSEIAKGNDTYEGLAAACGPVAVAEVVGVVETLKSVAPDAGPLAAKASRVHHVNAGK